MSNLTRDHIANVVAVSAIATVMSFFCVAKAHAGTIGNCFDSSHSCDGSYGKCDGPNPNVSYGEDQCLCAIYTTGSLLDPAVPNTPNYTTPDPECVVGYNGQYY